MTDKLKHAGGRPRKADGKTELLTLKMGRETYKKIEDYKTKVGYEGSVATFIRDFVEQRIQAGLTNPQILEDSSKDWDKSKPEREKV